MTNKGVILKPLTVILNLFQDLLQAPTQHPIVIPNLIGNPTTALVLLCSLCELDPCFRRDDTVEGQE